MWQLAANRRMGEQPVPDIGGTVPLVAAAGHEERQTDGHVKRL